ncbi:MAG TPA: GlsB/YeaQ/YmgE family stress response membrane protein [Anaerolineae bacterium]|nr:GlsB/YeaQ/YmgE family stress response membrane protein [Anaerolineae bacterium]
MNIIVYLIAGGIIGWLASIVMRTNAQQGILMNVIVGVVGAFVAGWFLTPLFGVGTINQGDFSMPALLVSLGGAILLLAVVRLFSRGGLRMR